MQISFDLGTLTKEQKEYICAVILQYPSGQYVKAIPEPATLKEQLAASVAAEDTPSPEAAFGSVASLGPQLVIPAPPASATPIATVPVTTQSSGGSAPIAGVDKDGLPWDSRIHSSNKALNTDGSWRKKRGVEDNYVKFVEGELKALMAIPAQPLPATTVHPTIPAPPAPEGNFSAVSVPPVPAEQDRTPFVNLVKKSVEAVTAKRVTNAELNAICLGHGVPSIAMSGHRPDLIPAINASIDALLLER